MADTRKVLLVDDHELVRYGVKTDVCRARRHPDRMDRGLVPPGSHRRIPRRSLTSMRVLLDLNLADCRFQGLRQFLRRHTQRRGWPCSVARRTSLVVRQARALGALGLYGARHHDVRDGYLTALLWPPRRLPMVARPSEHPASSSRASLFGHVRPGGRTRTPASGNPRVGVVWLHQPGDQQLDGPLLGTIKNYVSSLLLALDVRSRSHLISLFR